MIPATGANALAVAEYVICTVMMLLRGAYLATAGMAAGSWPARRSSQGRETAGKTLGIIGFGGIGRLVARLAQGLGMRVIATDPMLPAAAPAWAETGVARRELDALLTEADAVTLHVPLVPETRHLIDADRIATMRPARCSSTPPAAAWSTNRALAAALRGRRLAGAALDVFEDEPLKAGSVLAGVPNLVLTPHVAGVTVESNQRVSSLIAEKVLDVLRRSQCAVQWNVIPMTQIGLIRGEEPGHAQDQVERTCCDGPAALEGAGANPHAAAATAEALVAMDEQGLESHGVSRVPQYAGHLKSGRIDGHAEPRVVRGRGGALLVDAADGLAYPACTLAVAEAVARAGSSASPGPRSRIATTAAPSRTTSGPPGRRTWWRWRSATRPRRCPPGRAGGRSSAPIRSRPSFPARVSRRS